MQRPERWSQGRTGRRSPQRTPARRPEEYFAPRSTDPGKFPRPPANRATRSRGQTECKTLPDVTTSCAISAAHLASPPPPLPPLPPLTNLTSQLPLSLTSLSSPALFRTVLSVCLAPTHSRTSRLSVSHSLSHSLTSRLSLTHPLTHSLTHSPPRHHPALHQWNPDRPQTSACA